MSGFRPNTPVYTALGRAAGIRAGFLPGAPGPDRLFVDNKIIFVSSVVQMSHPAAGQWLSLCHAVEFKFSRNAALACGPPYLRMGR